MVFINALSAFHILDTKNDIQIDNELTQSPSILQNMNGLKLQNEMKNEEKMYLKNINSWRFLIIF